jgi:signal transduction histidine kinase
MQAGIKSRVVTATEIWPLLQQVPMFAENEGQELACLTEALLIEAPEGTNCVVQDEGETSFYILLIGQLRITRREGDGGINLLFEVNGGETLGEGALVFGFQNEPGTAEAVRDSTLLRIKAEAFWRLMADCPSMRLGVVATIARRFQVYQTLMVQRQSNISLGTLSAGLMHELNNPGSAALRAVSQMQENLTRLQKVCLRLIREELTAEQRNYSYNLLEQALSAQPRSFGSAIERADAEEELTTWMEQVGVEDGWRVAPTLVAVGWDRSRIERAQQAFAAEPFSDMLSFLEAFISSFQVLGTIEESLGRVTGLVDAVKKYANDDHDHEQMVDIHESLRSAVTIVSHKLRPKNLIIDLKLSPDLSGIKTQGNGLIQAWSNLLDNAIEASPNEGRITLRTWAEGRQFCVGIADQGPGIPPEKSAHIFEPFFTTKAFGSGPGLGLHIVHRIIVVQCAGQIGFVSKKGFTEFVVRLPIS